MATDQELQSEAIPQDLRALPQWVVWRREARHGKDTKVPYSVQTGKLASSTDPTTWCSFDEAVETSDAYDGIGFVFTESDAFCGIDLDACLDEAGRWRWGQELVQWLDTYAEVSPSGRGVKLILRGRKPEDARCVKRGMGPDGNGAIEIYDCSRFFTITGDFVDGKANPIADIQEKLAALCSYLWPVPSAPKAPASHDPSPTDPDDVERRAIGYLNSMPPAISGQHGHSATYAAATALVHGFCLAPERAFHMLHEHFNPRCEPPWSEKELRHKVNDAANRTHQRSYGWLRDTETSNAADDVDISQLIEALNGPDGKVESDPRPKAVVRRLSEVKSEPLQWLWPGRIPLGKFTLMAGDPGLGKSFVTLDMAARISRGDAWPDLPLLKAEPGTVIIFNAEDDLEDTIVPRLERADADRSRILAVEGVEFYDPQKHKNNTWYFSLQTDLPRLEEVIDENPDTRLVVIDPVSAYCDGIDTHKNAEVRSLLAPLSALASRYGVAILGITHLNKTGGGKAVYRSMGSLAFAAAARAVWSVVKDMDDPNRRLFLPAKLNLAQDPDGLAYRIVEGRVHWETDPVRMHADDAFAAELAAANSPPRGSERQEAREWLSEYLAGKKVASTEIMELAAELGFSEKTLRRAFGELGGKPRKSEFEGGWFWELPGQPPFAA